MSARTDLHAPRGSAAWIRARIIDVLESVPAADTPRKRRACARNLQELAAHTLDRWVVDHSALRLVTSPAPTVTVTGRTFSRSEDATLLWAPVHGSVLAHMAATARSEAAGHWSPMLDTLARFPPMRLALTLDACASALDTDLELESHRFDDSGNVWSEVAVFERGICVLAIQRLLSVCSHVFGEDAAGRPLPTIGSVFRAPGSDAGVCDADAEMTHLASYGLAEKLDAIVRVHEVRGLTERAEREARRTLTWLEWLTNAPRMETRDELAQRARDQRLVLSRMAAQVQELLLGARRAREPWLDVADARFANHLEATNRSKVVTPSLDQAQIEIASAISTFPQDAWLIVQAQRQFKQSAEELGSMYDTNTQTQLLSGNRELYRDLTALIVACRTTFGRLPSWAEIFQRFVWWYATTASGRG